jgi:hypothetical protein
MQARAIDSILTVTNILDALLCTQIVNS